MRFSESAWCFARREATATRGSPRPQDEIVPGLGAIAIATASKVTKQDGANRLLTHSSRDTEMTVRTQGERNEREG